MCENSQLKVTLKTVTYDDIIYSLNEEEKTASIVKCNTKCKDIIIIPTFINHESEEYIITNILKYAFSCCYNLEKNSNLKISFSKFINRKHQNSITSHIYWRTSF